MVYSRCVELDIVVQITARIKLEGSIGLYEAPEPLNFLTNPDMSDLKELWKNVISVSIKLV